MNPDLSLVPTTKDVVGANCYFCGVWLKTGRHGRGFEYAYNNEFNMIAHRHPQQCRNPAALAYANTRCVICHELHVYSSWIYVHNECFRGEKPPSKT